MSGGSYNYLCYKNSQEIGGYEALEEMEKMRDRLVALGYPDAAKETEQLRLAINSFHVRMDACLERINEVWQSVEWYDSGDSELKEVNEAIKKYRNNDKHQKS